MKKTFYTHAMIPKALRLTQLNENVIDQEIDFGFEAKMGLEFRHEGTNEFLGCNLNMVWHLEPNELECNIDPVDWFNVAGEIANEEPDDAKAFAIFRDFQYQLMFHVFKQEARKRGKKFMFYFATIFKENHEATKGILDIVGQAHFDQRPEDVLITALGTYPGYITSPFPSTMTPLAEIPYANLTFQRRGKRIFDRFKGNAYLVCKS